MRVFLAILFAAVSWFTFFRVRRFAFLLFLSLTLLFVFCCALLFLLIDTFIFVGGFTMLFLFVYAFFFVNGFTFIFVDMRTLLFFHWLACFGVIVTAFTFF